MAEPARKTVVGAATVRVASRRFGTFDVPADRIIAFDAGLVGFPRSRRFALLEPPRADVPFRHLVCVDDPEIGFVVCDPEEFWPGYSQHVPRPAALLGDAGVLVVVTIPARAAEMTANLMAPLVVELDRLRGWQLILDGGDYKTQHAIFPSAMAASAPR